MSALEIATLFPALSISEADNTQLKGIITDPKSIDHFLVYPFLTDQTTIDYIKQSKVLFINRGLPGSGKSTLSKSIANIYGTDKTIICSGDDFFTDNNGVYKFDQSKLAAAHSNALKKAEDACRDEKSPVISDNTNIQYWNVRKYLDIAKKYNYIVILIEPRTTFKFDVDKLFLGNKHNVPRDAIASKLSQYEVFVPFYFAWFLNHNDCSDLIQTAKKALTKCFYKIPNFKKDLKKFKDFIDPLELFSFKTGELHCTTKYIGGKRIASNSHEYYENPIVAENIGRGFELEIIGFCVSQFTISAIVRLSNGDQKSLWQNNLNEKEKNAILTDPFYANTDISSMLTQLEYGAHAHITLALAPEISAKQAVNDLINLKLRTLLQKKFKKPMDKISVDEYELVYFNDLYCLVKLNKAIHVKTIFSGYF